ncbi:MAG TPA: neutral zinc metallopeptidase, partial [Actinomycetes bacterium]|nr:neutral zinc metallopeptidase [Actinomycetes bacterium]
MAMRFDERSQLDTSQVTDARRARIPGGGIAVGGGVGIIGLILALLLGLNPFDTGGFPGLDQVQGGDNRQLEAECRTGADANAKADCRVVATVNSVQQYWTAEFERRGGRYQPSRTTLFSGATGTGCGTA